MDYKGFKFFQNNRLFKLSKFDMIFDYIDNFFLVNEKPLLSFITYETSVRVSYCLMKLSEKRQNFSTRLLAMSH